LLACINIAALLCFMTIALHAQQSSVQEYVAAFWSEAEESAEAPPPSPAPEADASAAVAECAVEGIAKPGSIHHIRGRVFVAGAALPDVVERLRDYDNHRELFAPTLREAKVCNKEDDQTFEFRYWSTPYMDSITQMRAVHRRVSDSRYVVTSTTTAFGTPGDLENRKDLCKGTLPGVFYMKQLLASWRYDQTPEGVKIQGDVVAELSGFALVRATSRRVLKQIMEQSLEQYKRRFGKPRALK
jgi:hypothetical protein